MVGRNDTERHRDGEVVAMRELLRSHRILFLLGSHLQIVISLLLFRFSLSQLIHKTFNANSGRSNYLPRTSEYCATSSKVSKGLAQLNVKSALYRVVAGKFPPESGNCRQAS